MKALLDWILRSATFKAYTSPVPEGKHLGGHDIPAIRDLFLILDVRVANRCMIFGYFQFT